MEDKIITPMQDFLPGALSKWILVSSIALSGFLLLIPSYDLPAKYTTDKDLIALLLRLLSAGLPLLIGSISLIALLVRHNRKMQAELSNTNAETTKLSQQVSSLTTDKNTLQSLLDTSRQTLQAAQREFTALHHSSADLERINNEREFLLKVTEKALFHLREDLRRHKKYLTQYAPAGFDIVQQEEYEKGWNEANKNHDK